MRRTMKKYLIIGIIGLMGCQKQVNCGIVVDKYIVPGSAPSYTVVIRDSTGYNMPYNVDACTYVYSIKGKNECLTN